MMLFTLGIEIFPRASRAVERWERLDEPKLIPDQVVAPYSANRLLPSNDE
jgi:hypothetical protein